MTSNSDVITRWHDVVRGKATRLIGSPHSNNVFGRGDVIYSYGTHFPMAEVVRDEDCVSFFLINGDRYSPTTNRHQSDVRAELRDEETLTVPFSVLSSAGIDRQSIRIVESRPERHDDIKHSSTKLDDLPVGNRKRFAPAIKDYVPVEPDEQGLYHWTTYRHWLGSSVFTAEVVTARYYLDEDGERRYSQTRDRRYFLSAFDEQEPQPLYFLAELPGPVESYEDAIEALKPETVRYRESFGYEVLRQGDIFAVETDLLTAELRKDGATFEHRGKVTFSEDGAHIVAVEYGRLLETSHTATDTAVLPDGRVYAKGVMRHEPQRWGGSEHRRVSLNGGKTWYRILKNTVPEGRSWSRGGNVD